MDEFTENEIKLIHKALNTLSHYLNHTQNNQEFMLIQIHRIKYKLNNIEANNNYGKNQEHILLN